MTPQTQTQTQTQTQDRVGTKLADGRYRISARIGEGSMGQVYLADDRHLDTDVVVKFPIPPEFPAGGSEFRERFARESRTMIRLGHPHIVKVIDVGEDDGLPFVVMAYLDGGSLKDRLAPGPGAEPRPSPPESLHGWLVQIAAALDFIHGQGHIHRDVKPGNILFDRHGNAYLADFGVVKAIGVEAETWAGRSALTAPGYLLGTPNYVAPELVMGLPGDGRADQYALALSIHEALAGWNCMEGPTPSATMVNQTKVPPPPLGVLLRDVPTRLSDAVLRGLSKAPEERFPSCLALAREVLADVPAPVPGRPASTPVLAAPVSSGEPGRVPCPSCGGPLPVTRDHAGRRVTCTRCRATSVVQVRPPSGTMHLLLVESPKAGGFTDSSATPVLYGPETGPATGPLTPAKPWSDSTFGPAPALGRGRRSLLLAGLATLGVLIALGGWIIPGAFRGEPQAPPIRRDAAKPPADLAGPIELNIAYGTEKTRWLEGAVAAFRDWPAGRGIQINLIGMGSVEGAEAVLKGPEPRPIHAWSPASSAYTNVFESEWKYARGGSKSPILRSENLVLTPMVFVFWKERHDAFIARFGRVDFRTLNQAMREPGGWSSIAGKPEWGLFRFAHTDPAKSNSGLMTLVLMAYEYAGKQRDLRLEDITTADFQDAFGKFERNLTRHNGSLVHSTGKLMEQMILRGPSQYDCLVLYENLAIDSMKAAERNFGELRVVYPEPNLWNEHPFYVLDVPWSDKRHQDAATEFLKFLMTEQVQRQALRHGFRPGNPTISIRSAESPLGPMEKYGIRLDIPRVADPPIAAVVKDLLAAYRRVP